MCQYCWAKCGAHKIDNDQVREASALIAGVYEYSGVGGNLHIAIDDFNLEDDALEFCAGAIRDSESTGEYESGQCDAERLCLEKLKAMSLEERVSALALHDGFWG
jgi:hypothetical protein